MAQHDYVIDDQDGVSFLADLANLTAAIASNNSGATAPSTTYASQFWADTSSGLLKMRNAANTAWVTIGTMATIYLGLASLSVAQSWSALQTFASGAAMSNSNLSGIKTATFNSQVNNATTSGSITIDWTSGQCQKQAEPTGTITYAFTAPAGPCHLQLLIDSDGTSTAQTINWPGTVKWLGATWAGLNNKAAVINFWYDGTNYYAMGVNQV